MKHDVDVLVVGAGPAGLTAALRLQQLGYRVHILERSAQWPRPQIGEALTPGVRNIIDLLNANDALEAVPHLAHLPTRLRWRNNVPEIVAHGDAAVVNRALFDAALMQLARQRGIGIFHPAQIKEISGSSDNWLVQVSTDTGVQYVSTRLIMDARGRSNSSQATQIACAPRLSAVWAELEPADIPVRLENLTQVEALEHGWLWGASLPDRRYRVMWVGDPQTAHQQMPGKAEQWVRYNCASSRLFSSLANVRFASHLQACVATPYLALNCWQDGQIKLGDAAFSLDPVSSSGVEKAMRFSLQAAVSAHTVLSSSEASRHALAHNFLEQRLIETCARHSYWTQSYYGQAWCAELPFWQDRSGFDTALSSHRLASALHSQITALRTYQPSELRQLASFDPYHPLRISPEARLVEVYGVAEDKVQKQLALSHPNLERPISYLEQEALFPQLDFLWQAQSFAGILKKLEGSMGMQKSQKVVAWLWQRGILENLA